MYPLTIIKECLWWDLQSENLHSILELRYNTRNMRYSQECLPCWHAKHVSLHFAFVTKFLRVALMWVSEKLICSQLSPCDNCLTYQWHLLIVWSLDSKGKLNLENSCRD
jgi:hypothetical protein